MVEHLLALPRPYVQSPGSKTKKQTNKREKSQPNNNKILEPVCHPSVVLHTWQFLPSGDRAGGWLSVQGQPDLQWVLGQPELHGETLS